MNDLDLGTRIRAAAPRLSSPLGLAEHSTRILKEARSRRRRNLRTWAVGVAASVVIVGGGTVAVAGDGMFTPWGWTADNVYQFPGPNGQTCFAGLLVQPDDVADDAEVVIAAREIVAGLDLDALDTSVSTARLIAENDQPYGDGTPGVMHWTPEQIAMFAVQESAADALFAELERRGLTPDDGKDYVYLFSQQQGCQ